MAMKLFDRGDSVHEKSDVEYECTFKEAAAGQPQLNAAAITAILLTVSDVKTNTIINGRTAVSVRNVNGGTLAADGKFTLQLSAADNALVDQTVADELHRLVLQVTYQKSSGGTGSLTHEVRFFVVNIGHVT